MKRENKISECENLLTEESPEHLHIRREAIVSGFTDDLFSELEQFEIVTVDISEWDHGELMETLRYELQKELSIIKHIYSRLTSIGSSFFGFGVSAGVESRPDYSRTTDYLNDVSKKKGNHLLVYVNFHGDRPVDGFNWIPKLDTPDNTTIVTDGFQKCDLDNSIEFQIGRLSKEETVDYLTNIHGEIDNGAAVEIHNTHDGNPVAIEIASQQNSLKQQLSGEALRELWSTVYDDKISGEELDLLTDSSHLIDLDQRDVASVTDKTRGEAKELLKQLESKGVVSQKQSGLFTTDKYVKRYTAAQLSGTELSKQHRMSFHDYVEKWVDTYESRVEEMRSRGEGLEGEETISPPDLESELTDPDLFLAIHHLSEIHNNLDQEDFISELEDVNADPSGLFTFGMITQRFFFEDPNEILQELSESILGIEGDIDSELFTSTLSILFDFDLGEFVAELASGWSGEINTDRLDTKNASEPDRMVQKLQKGISSELFDKLPSDVTMALARLVALAVTDSRTAREYFNRFGKTAEKYGLEEEAFCQWMAEVEDLVNELDPETGEDNSESDPYEESFESLDSAIRDRIDLKKYLEENHSQAQNEFQQRVEKIRSKPDRISEQYINCGDQLAKTENTLFPYLWYVFGNEVFSKIILGEQNWEIYGEYKKWSGAREEQEKNFDDDELVLTIDEIEGLFG